MIKFIIGAIGLYFFFKLSKTPVKKDKTSSEMDISEISDEELFEEINKYL